MTNSKLTWDVSPWLSAPPDGSAGPLKEPVPLALDSSNMIVSNSSAVIYGTSGNDNITGTSGNDTIDVSQGGNDVVNAGGGNDTILMRASFTPADQIDGGTGTDTVSLNGDYSFTSLVFSATTMVNVEKLLLRGDHNYYLTTNDATVAAGQTLTVDGSMLGAGGALKFNGNAETNGNFVILGGAGNDIITAGAGNDTISTGAGSDSIDMGANLTTADKIDGGADFDSVSLSGDYASTPLVFGATTMVNVESLYLAAGHSYNLTTNDATVAAGQRLYIEAYGLGASNSLILDGSAETDGALFVDGGAGNDRITTGSGDDQIILGSGNDVVSAGGGNDHISGHNSKTTTDQIDGGAGDDLIWFEANFTAADQIDGGTGMDTVQLDGDYAKTPLVFGATTMVNVEDLELIGGRKYNLTTNDATVAAGQTLKIEAYLDAADTLTFNGSAETDGNFIIFSGAGNDTITSGAGNDVIKAGAGTDSITMGANLTAADQIDGGTGSDTVYLSGDYATTPLVFGATTMVNVETLSLAAGHSYNFTTNDTTVAAGQTLTVDGHRLGTGDTLVFNGSAETDGNFVIKGGGGNDVVTVGGGVDTVVAGAGNDTIYLGAHLTAADSIDGGSGLNTAYLAGDYATTPLVFQSRTLTNIETLVLAGGYSYNLKTVNGTVAAGKALTVDGSALGAADTLTFNGSAETDGNLIIYGGAGNDNIRTGAGNVKVYAGDGNDIVYVGANFTALDRIDGGAGSDTVVLAGDYATTPLVFATATMRNVEKLTLTAGFSYNLTSHDVTVPAGQVMTIDGSALGAGDALIFNGAAEMNGSFRFLGGLGADTFTGGAGADAFVYSTASQSTSTSYDTLNAVNFDMDLFDTPGNAGTITAIDAAVTSGTLSTATFDTDLASAVSGLGAHHAMLFTPNGGTLAGDTFMVVDLNGTSGYQAGQDLVIRLSGATGTLTTGAFT